MLYDISLALILFTIGLIGLAKEIMIIPFLGFSGGYLMIIWIIIVSRRK